MSTNRLFVLFVCCAVIFTDMVGYSIIAPSIPLFAKLFGASDAVISYAFAAYPVAFLLTIIPFGFVVDRIGKNHLVIGIGMFSLAAACLVLILSESIFTFSLARAFQGIGSAASWVAAQPLAAQQIDTSKKQGLEIGSITVAMGLGMILGPLIGSIGGLRTPFVINLFLALGIGILSLLSLRGEHLKEKVVNYDYLSIVKRTNIVIACLVIMFLFASTGMMEVLFPLYIDSLGYMKGSIGVLFFVLSLFLVLGQPFTGPWMDKVGPYLPIFLGFIVIALSLSLMVLFKSFAGWVPVFVLFGVALGMLTSASMLLIALNSKPGEQGAAYGIWNFSFSVGYLVGPALGGTLSDMFRAVLPSVGIRAPFFIFSLFIISSVLILRMVVAKRKQQIL
ncbi:MAG TPA: MFS transporter [Thermodesulfobacteriota bacterium]|nr:MFS transporter [Thermodesulfobacteriota bacterium]